MRQYSMNHTRLYSQRSIIKHMFLMHAKRTKIICVWSVEDHRFEIVGTLGYNPFHLLVFCYIVPLLLFVDVLLALL